MSTKKSKDADLIEIIRLAELAKRNVAAKNFVRATIYLEQIPCQYRDKVFDAIDGGRVKTLTNPKDVLGYVQNASVAIQKGDLLTAEAIGLMLPEPYQALVQKYVSNYEPPAKASSSGALGRDGSKS